MAKRYYWLKLKDDFFKQKEIKKLRKIAGGDTYTIIYLKLMLLSLENQGNLFFDKVEDNFHEELALQIDEDSDDVTITINYLKSKGLIDLIDSETMMLNHIPDLIGSESESAERVRKHRNLTQNVTNLLQNNGNALHCNTNVQNCNGDIDIELDIDKDINKDKEKRKKKSVKSVDYDSIVSLVNEFSKGNERLKETLLSFCEMRKEIKAPLTERALKILFNELRKITNDEEEMISILEQSILKSWKGIFPLNNKPQKYVKEDIIPEHHLQGYVEPNKVAEIDRSELIRKIKGN
jgi:predicted phage replisome organizer